MKQKKTVFIKLANVIQKAADELEKADPNYFMLLHMLGGEAVQEVNPATGEPAIVYPLNRPAKQREELLKVAKAAYAMGLAARYTCSGERYQGTGARGWKIEQRSHGHGQMVNDTAAKHEAL